MTAPTPATDPHCVQCFKDTSKQIAYGRVFHNGRFFCSFRCFSYDTTKKKEIGKKICCICVQFLKNTEKFEVSKGYICSNKCFHLWLDDGMCKFIQHMAEKAIYQKKMRNG